MSRGDGRRTAASDEADGFDRVIARLPGSSCCWLRRRAVDGAGAGRLRRAAAADGRRDRRAGARDRRRNGQADPRRAGDRGPRQGAPPPVRPRRTSEHAAYRNRPLPIGYGQTISQPYIVALMTDLMNLRARAHGAGDRHGLRLPGGDPGGARADRLHDRDHRAARAAGRGAPARARATRARAPGSATATTAGRTAGRSTRSSSPPPRATSRRR